MPRRDTSAISIVRLFLNILLAIQRIYAGGGHNNVIWWFWYQGVNNAPEVCKACLASLKHWYPDKKIITIDKDNLSKYVTLPDYINHKHEQGIIDNTKYSNMIRLQLLIEHGGAWIDSTIFFTGRKFEELLDLPLFLFRWSERDVSVSDIHSGIDNWFIVSDPHNPILELVRDLHYAYWKDHDYLVDYFIFHTFFEMAAQVYRQEWEKVPFMDASLPYVTFEAAKAGELYSEERMKYFESLSGFHKLTYKTLVPHQWDKSAIIPKLIERYRDQI